VDLSASSVSRWLGGVRTVLDTSAAFARLLVLPLALLLFLQWPLREIVHAGSRESNDLAQIVFALYVAVAVSAATRGRTHLAADAFAERYSTRTRERLARAGALLVLAPWCVFVLVSAAPMVWNAVRQFEAFGETLNPGYFLVKVAVAVLAALLLLQAVLDVVAPGDRAP
jgi:TRAP-type C4-dicarboxylate transport system permease small subunit